MKVGDTPRTREGKEEGRGNGSGSNRYVRPSALLDSLREQCGPLIRRSQYDWTGTIDWSSYLTIPTALSFREEIGGEERVMGYCRSLALRGGKRLGKKWGTRVIYGDEAELVAAMVS